MRRFDNAKLVETLLHFVESKGQLQDGSDGYTQELDCRIALANQKRGDRSVQRR